MKKDKKTKEEFKKAAKKKGGKKKPIWSGPCYPTTHGGIAGPGGCMGGF